MLLGNRQRAGHQVAGDRNANPTIVFSTFLEDLDQLVHHRPVFPTREIGNHQITCFIVIENDPSRCNDPFLGNDFGFFGVKAKSLHRQHCISEFTILVLEELALNQLHTCFTFKVQVAGNQSFEATHLQTTAGSQKTFEHLGVFYFAADAEHREVKSTTIWRRRVVFDHLKQTRPIHSILEVDQILIGSFGEFVVGVKRKERFFVLEEVLKELQPIGSLFWQVIELPEILQHAIAGFHRSGPLNCRRIDPHHEELFTNRIASNQQSPELHACLDDFLAAENLHDFKLGSRQFFVVFIDFRNFKQLRSDNHILGRHLVCERQPNTGTERTDTSTATGTGCRETDIGKPGIDAGTGRFRTDRGAYQESEQQHGCCQVFSKWAAKFHRVSNGESCKIP